jgi:hypothetical protein
MNLNNNLNRAEQASEDLKTALEKLKVKMKELTGGKLDLDDLENIGDNFEKFKASYKVKEMK